MHGCGGEKWKQRRHMWPVHSNSTTVAADLSPPDFYLKDGRKIDVGDCALFKPPQDSPPFIGIIRAVKLDKEGNVAFDVNWLYRPSDIKLAKGILLDAAPNEVFYSFHKDEIPAASLLHPCKVSFLRKGVELPSGISSFVCRRVYDTDHKCLWWLTDKDYINERQEEVDQLLDKTRIEMHGAGQSGGRSPKPLNGPTSAPLSKSGSDSVQNNSSFTSQLKGKKRDRTDQGSEPAKRERVAKSEDGESGHLRPENTLKSEISKITEKGGLIDFAGVEKLVKLMQPEVADKKIDLACKIMLVDVIALTERFDCLGGFLQLKGLPILDEWLQEIHKGKTGDGSRLKESDKVEEFLFALLRALDNLPVDLNALQSCNIGKSVNHLRSHKNSEIQRKARSLVDTWKKRVDAEINISDSKSGSGRSVSWPAKPVASDVSHVANRKPGGSTEGSAKGSNVEPATSKNSQIKPGPGTGSAKCNPSTGVTSKDQNFRTLESAGASDPPLTPAKEERSNSSGHSQNNSQSSDHAKTMASSFKEEKKRSTVVSVNKVSGSVSRHRKPSGRAHGTGGVSGVQRENESGRTIPTNRNLTVEKASAGSHEKFVDVPPVDNANGRLIVKFPNTSKSPSGGTIGATEDPAVPCSREAALMENSDNNDKKGKGRSDVAQGNVVTDANSILCSKDDLTTAEQGQESSPSGEPVGPSEEEFPKEAARTTVVSGKSYDARLSSINALIDSCVKFSDTSVATSGGDDGMNLLASVAAGEISKSNNVSPEGSPAAEDSSPVNSEKMKQSCGEVSLNADEGKGGCSGGMTSTLLTDGNLLQTTNPTSDPVRDASTDLSEDKKCVDAGNVQRVEDYSANSNASSINLQCDADSSIPRSDITPGEIACGTCLAVPQTDKDASAITGETNQFPDQNEERKPGFQKEKLNVCISDSKLNATPMLHDNRNTDRVVEKPLDSGRAMESAANITPKVEKEVDEKLQYSSSEVDAENLTCKETISSVVMEQKLSLAPEISSDAVKKKVEDVVAPCGFVNLDAATKAENFETARSGSHSEQSERQIKDPGPVGSERNINHMEGASVQHLGSTFTPVKEGVQSDVFSGQSKLSSVDTGGVDDRTVLGVKTMLSAAQSDTAVKLDFDLNEGILLEDGNLGELSKPADVGNSAPVKMPCPLPFPVSSMSGSFPTLVTLASAAKGLAVPPENLSRTKGEDGWKGSAATSAFRPAEPRKNPEIRSSTVDATATDTTSTKQQGRAALDFDLNVPDQGVLDDVGSQSAIHGSQSGPCNLGAVGLDLDLNRVDESPDIGQFSMSKSRSEIPPRSSRSSFSEGLSNGGVNVSRDFDLNNGPCVDEAGTETVHHNPQNKTSLPLQPTMPGLRSNSLEFVNFSSWFSTGNAYSALPAVPSILPGRVEQNYAATAGSQRIFATPSGSSPFPTEIFRGPVLSSSPAMAFPPANPFQYPGYPFEAGFPLSSNSFSGCSTAYMDSSSGGTLCFPTLPSQLVSPATVVSAPYPRPYIMSLPGGSNNVSPDSRKWGSQGLDLNTGPGSSNVERRDERLPAALRHLPVPSSHAYSEDQLKMFQVGGVLKRKEPDGSLDGGERFGYKHPSWQ